MYNKLVLSQSVSAAKMTNANLHGNVRPFNRETHLYGLHNQRRFVFIIILIGFQAFLGFIYFVCERVHWCDELHSWRLYEMTESTSKN